MFLTICFSSVFNFCIFFGHARELRLFMLVQTEIQYITKDFYSMLSITGEISDTEMQIVSVTSAY